MPCVCCKKTGDRKVSEKREFIVKVLQKGENIYNTGGDSEINNKIFN